MRRVFISALAVLFVLASVAACSGSSAPAPASASPAVSGPTLQGRLLLETSDFTVWTIVSHGGGVTETKLLSAKGPAAVSPDRTTLAYAGAGDLVFRDLGTGATTSAAVPGALGDCLAWAPDGRHVLFQTKDGSLYIASTQGAVTLVDQPRHATYVELNGTPGFGQDPAPPPGAPTFNVGSQVTCGSWLDADRLVFDRLTGPFPQTVQLQGSGSAPGPVSPDTTTVAVLTGAAVSLVDSADQWKLDSLCADYLLTEKEKPAADTTAPNLYLVPAGATTAALTSPGGALPAGAAVPDLFPSDTAAFLPGTCTLYIVGDARNAQEHSSVSRFVPGSHSLTSAPALQDKMSFTDDVVWAPGPTPDQFVDWGGGFVRIFDVTTGADSEIPLSDSMYGELYALLAWLP